MDHLKKKLLKTRHKTSESREEISNEEKQIVVWVGQEAKVVCGLTKHTTTEDVVEAILEECLVLAQNNNVLFGSPNEYCILESWKDFKRILPPSLQIIKLLKSWGEEETNVSFFLFKTCTLLYPCLMWWSSQKNLVHDDYRNHPNVALHIKDFPLDMRKRIVRKAFRKLEKMKKDLECPKENNIKQLIHVIMSQDNIIKQQIDRLREVDDELEAYELYQQKLEKFECNGENVESCLEAEDPEIHPEMQSLENLMHIEEELDYQYTLIRKLSDEIKVEMSPICLQEDEDCFEEGFIVKETSIKQELDESLQVGIRLQSLYGYIQKEIQNNDSILLQQKREYETLKDELKSVCASNPDSSLCDTPEQSSDVSSSKEVCDNSTVLSNMDIQNDTDSDTGISSTHSQDLDPSQ